MSDLRDKRKRHDYFYRRARQESFAARSVFKLEEIDRRFRLLRRGARVLDLGCRPGSWLQYAAKRVGAAGCVIGLDRRPLELPLPANARVLVGDVLAIAPEELRAALPIGCSRCFDVVLSDMAPDTTGVAVTDQARSIELFLRALHLSVELGCPSGHFVGKLFMGEGFTEAQQELRAHYGRIKTVRPEATRRSSTELYMVALGRRSPAPEARQPQ